MMFSPCTERYMEKHCQDICRLALDKHLHPSPVWEKILR